MQTFESHSFINPSTPQGIYLPAYLMGDIPNSTMVGTIFIHTLAKIIL